MSLLYQNLNIYFFVSLFLLAAGILGIVYRKTLIGMLISLELIMNGAGLNFVAMNRYVAPESGTGMVFTLFIMGIAAAEAAISLGIIILIFRRFKHIRGEELKEMKE